VAKPLFLQKMFEVQMCLLGHIPPNQSFSAPFGTPELPKISLPSREWEWELTFFRECDRDRDYRKCLPLSVNEVFLCEKNDNAVMVG
jgi:hypothetical protein